MGFVIDLAASLAHGTRPSSDEGSELRAELGRVALEGRAEELRRQLEPAERGLGPLGKDGFYGSGL
jgi:hypothetical protein